MKGRERQVALQHRKEAFLMRGEKGFKYQRREKLLEARRLRKARSNPARKDTISRADYFAMARGQRWAAADAKRRGRSSSMLDHGVNYRSERTALLQRARRLRARGWKVNPRRNPMYNIYRNNQFEDQVDIPAGRDITAALSSMKLSGDRGRWKAVPVSQGTRRLIGKQARRNPVEFGTYMADQFRRMSTAKLQSYLGSGGSREHLARTEIKRRHR